jgi:hypothetical protein
MGATGAMVAGSAITAYNQYETGQLNGRLAKLNSQMADFQAETAIRNGSTEEQRLRKAGKQLAGAQRASLAAQGISLEDGTALDLQVDTAQQVELDALTIRNNARLAAFGFKTQSRDLALQGKLDKIGGMAEAGNTLLTGGIRGYSTYRSLNPAKPKAPKAEKK